MAGYADMTRAIRDNALGKLYLFYGEESYLREHCLALLQNKLMSEDAVCFNLHRFSGKKLTLQELTDAVEGVPFLCDKKLVIVEDFSLMDIPSAERDAWAALLSELSDTCCLVFVYDTLPYKPDGRNKIQAVLKQYGQMIEFEAQKDSHLVTWIAKNFREMKKLIDRQTCEYLIFRCGHSMMNLKQEMKKIASFSSGDTVTKDVINEITEPVLDAVVFDLTDAIAAGDIKKAANVLQTLQWMQESPESVIGAVGRAVRGLYAARLAIDTGKSAKHIMDVCGYRNSYPAEKMLRNAKKLSPDWCRSALLSCREADAMLKGEGRERILEWLLAKIA